MLCVWLLVWFAESQLPPSPNLSGPPSVAPATDTKEKPPAAPVPVAVGFVMLGALETGIHARSYKMHFVSGTSEVMFRPHHARKGTAVSLYLYLAHHSSLALSTAGTSTSCWRLRLQRKVLEKWLPCGVHSIYFKFQWLSMSIWLYRMNALFCRVFQMLALLSFVLLR